MIVLIHIAIQVLLGGVAKWLPSLSSVLERKTNSPSLGLLSAQPRAGTLHPSSPLLQKWPVNPRSMVRWDISKAQESAL